MNLTAQLILVLKGVLVGFGAIMPGISGGTLCVAFGMYRPLMNVLSHPKKTLKTDGMRLLFFLIGAAAGFVGLSGLAGWLMEKDSLAVTCVFIGFILGTLPELWKGAGEKGRPRSAWISMAVGFLALTAILALLRTMDNLSLAPGTGSFFFCGILWGLSFVVPGLSSSTLLIFFGLYQPMLEGISHLSLPVLLPLGAGVLLCLAALPKAVNAAYRSWHPQISHAILGIVAASMLMVIPAEMLDSVFRFFSGALCIAAGCIASLAASLFCGRLEEGNTQS